MRPRRTVAVVLAAACTLPGCATTSPDVFGRQIQLVPKEPGAGRLDGELLAVQDGRVWLRTKEGVRDYPAGSFREIRVRRHDLGGSTRRLALVGGAVSMAALTIACSSVEGNEVGGCAAAGAVIGGILAGTGLLASLSLDGSSRLHVSPSDEALRGYSRFPAGMPKGVPPEWLMRTPDDRKRAAHRID